MRTVLYAKLAADNVKRNSQTYIPYLITCIIASAMLYIITSLSLNSGIDNMRGGYALKEILNLGVYITRIFAFIFLFYTNSFLIKRRKKEFGLLNILGMEKRHIARLLLTETVYTAAISLLAGICAGILLDKLLFLLLTKMMGESVQLGFYISQKSLITTCVFMLFIYLMIYLNALRQIHLASPVELLMSTGMGEKEPKAKWITAVLGIVMVGIGYYISIVTTQPLQALTLFFIAVLCVIIGTYFLFAAGSIAFLKLMKKNKKYYYKIKNFTTVSGMIYRMKQNAVGLANICILSTMVLVMVSSTVCLIAGIDDIIERRYPYDFMITSEDPAMQDKTDKYLSENGVDTKDVQKYTSLEFAVVCEENSIFISDPDTAALKDLYELEVMDLTNYNLITGSQEQLDENTVLLYNNDKKINFDEFRIFDMELSADRYLDSFPNEYDSTTVGQINIVVKNSEIVHKLYELQKDAYGKNASYLKNHYNFNLCSGNNEELYNSLVGLLKGDTKNWQIDAKYDAHENAMSLYGGLFFLGTFLGILFMMETILIIYYKQVSEGFDDKKRFEIMQNVGMSKTEVKKTIRSQIIKMFFLPLITAGIHTLFSFPLIKRLLIMLNMSNTALFAVCLSLSFAAFACIYALIYSLTAKTYYKIVSK